MEKQEIQCVICRDTDGLIEAIPCDENDHHLLYKIFRCTNVQVQPVAGYISAVCEACWQRIDAFPDDDEIDLPTGTEYANSNGIHHNDPLEVKAEPYVEFVVKNEPIEDGVDGGDNGFEGTFQVKEEIIDDTGPEADELHTFCDMAYNDNQPKLDEHLADAHPESLDNDQSQEPGRPKAKRTGRTNKSDAPAVPKSQQKHQCNECLKTFANNTTLEAHMYIHKGGDFPFKCDQCPRKYNLQTNLKLHQRVAHNVAGVRPRLAVNPEVARKQLAGALIAPFKCDVCAKQHKSAELLRKHLKRHIKLKKTYPCDSCPEEFTSEVMLKKHRQDNHEFIRYDVTKDLVVNPEMAFKQLSGSFSPPYQCEICLKHFGYMDILKQHLVRHMGERNEFNCELCSLSYTSKATLGKHRRQVHPDAPELIHKPVEGTDIASRQLESELSPPYQCEVCHKEFPEAGHLKVHLRMHIPFSRKVTSEKYLMGGKGIILNPEVALQQLKGKFVKPYRCDVCANIFSGLRNFRDHLRLHVALDYSHFAIQCSLCPKWFHQIDLLRAHKRDVHGTEHKAGSNFEINPEVAQRQLASKLVGPPFVCAVCQNVYSSPYTLRDHLRLHTVEKFRCDRCSFQFASRWSLLKHQKMAHGDGIVKKRNRNRSNHRSTSPSNLPVV